MSNSCQKISLRFFIDTDPRRVEALIEITEKLKDSENIEAMDPLNKVLQESLLYIAHGKKRYFDPTLGTVVETKD